MTAPVELSREDVLRILALAAKCPVKPTDPIADGWYEEHDLLRTHKIALRSDAQLIAACDPEKLTSLCQAALRGMESQGLTEVMIAAAREAYWMECNVTTGKEGMRRALEAALSARTQARGEREPPHCPTCDCATPAKST